jgi:hypothetical protein
LLAAVTDPAGRITGVHRTWLYGPRRTARIGRFAGPPLALLPATSKLDRN